MKYWFDTEFIEYPCTIDLISIGIVSEDGRELYNISSEFDESKADPWVVENVINKLEPQPGHPHNSAICDTVQRLPKSEIAKNIQIFTGYEPSEFWAYYADYDWVVFCWLFGSMVKLPEGYPMYCRDIKQLADSLGNPDIPKQEEGEHNALADARWNRDAWTYLSCLHSG